MENIETFEGGEVVHLNQEQQAMEQKDTAEMQETETIQALQERFDKLKGKIENNPNAEDRIELQREMDEIQEKLEVHNQKAA